MSLCVELYHLARARKTLWMFIFRLLMSKLHLTFSELTFPNFCKEKEFRKFIALMLTKNPLNRLIKLQLIKESSWFKSFDWV
jgi:hypothetical protein